MRQVGKSTLLKKFSQRYQSFDDYDFLMRFDTAAKTILDQEPYPLALDEIQKHPPAFDAIKHSIDSFKRPGKFIVSGSVRFSSRQQIRESLTGRITLIELMPLTLAECHGKTASEFLSLTSRHTGKSLEDKLKTRIWATEKQIIHYSQLGGLPGISFKREDVIRQQLFDTHLDTILGRDIQLIVNTKLSVKKLKLILIALAREQGQPISYSKLARLASVSAPTIQNLIMAMQGLFLIRSYGKTYYVEDSGLSHFLNPQLGHLNRMDMIRFLFQEFKTQYENQLKYQATIEPYVTRGGIDIPFVLTFKNGMKIALTVEDSDLPSDKSTKSLIWYRKRYQAARLIILTRDSTAYTTTSGIHCLPWTWAF